MFPTRMFAPRMFAPRVFPGASAGDGPVPGYGIRAMFAPRMFAPRMFAPRVFPSGDRDPVVVVTAGPNEIYQDIQARLLALNVFAEVKRANWSGLSTMIAPSCLIRSKSEIGNQIGAAPITWDVTGSYELVITVDDRDEEARFDALRIMAAKCKNALNNVRLAGITKPMLTSLKAGRDVAKPTHPIGQLILDGTWIFETDQNQHWEGGL